MSWLLLFFAGFLEVIWAISIKNTDGFTKLKPSIITLSAMIVSFYLLSLSLRTLPLGVAYAIWVGIGAVGTTIAGFLIFQEPITLMKTLSLLLIIIGIVGLKLSSMTS